MLLEEVSTLTIPTQKWIGGHFSFFVTTFWTENEARVEVVDKLTILGVQLRLVDSQVCMRHLVKKVTGINYFQIFQKRNNLKSFRVLQDSRIFYELVEDSTI